MSQNLVPRRDAKRCKSGWADAGLAAATAATLGTTLTVPPDMACSRVPGGQALLL